MQLLGAVKGVAAPPNGSTLFSGVSLRARKRRAKADDDGSSSTSSGFGLGLRRSSSTSNSADSTDTPPGPVTLPDSRPRATSRPAATFNPPLYHHRRQPHDVAVHGSMPLDTVSKSAPPHVAVRYGDTIRLFARSKYAGPTAAGGYVGTFEGGKRFLASKNAQKQDELACIPPIAACAAKQFKESVFTILSNCGLGVGTPVSYGDVVVLVDAAGRVWNNKMGVGPSTKNGCFGPKESNTPGEMYLSFYQLQPDTDGDDSSSDSSDDEDNFLFFSNLAKTTKTMAETTFGKPTQVELHLATAALRTMGKVMYYGDRNLIIDVADSNRTRSKFNRVITHFSKQQEGAPVQGGHLRCDGRGKTILFEMHGQEFPSIQSIDTKDVKESNDSSQVSEEAGHRSPSSRVLVSTRKDVEVGTSIVLQDLRRSMMLVLHFSDGGRLRIPCQRFLKHEGRAFYRVVLNGKRPMRVLVRATRAVGRKKGDLRGTLRGTYRQIFKLSCGIVLAYLSAASVFTHVFGSIVVLPAVYVGLTVAVLVFSVEVFFPGQVVTARQIKPKDEHQLGNWNFTIVALEASDSERLENTSNKAMQEAAAIKVPPAFVVAENGDVAKATERYQNTLAWRKEVLADSILTMPQTHYDSIKANYTQFLHKHDKLGHPLYIEKIGSINIPQLKKAGVSQEALFKHYLFAMEFTIKYAAHQICPCDACVASKTQKMCIVLDARGIGMRDMGGEAFEFIRRCTSVMQHHYPQRSFKIFIVNVPSWFGMAWKGVKPLLNEATRAKTNILTESETAGALLEFIDAENLPVEYGGTCSCAGGCETHSSYQRLQRALVQSVLECKPFEADELIQSIAMERSGESRSSSEGDASSSAMPASAPPPVMGPIKRETSATAVLDQLFRIGSSSTDDGFTLDGVDDEGFCRSIPAGFFSEEVLKAGYLLKRSLRHKQFNPIWHRQLFILHPQFLRFAKTLDSEIYQIVSLTHDTVVQKTTKQNNSFEIITPLMAANGHSLLLYAPTPSVLNTWVDAIQGAIEQMKLRAPTPAASPERSPIVSPRAKQEASPEPDDQPTALNAHETPRSEPFLFESVLNQQQPEHSMREQRRGWTRAFWHKAPETGSHSGRIDSASTNQKMEKMEIPSAFLVAENGDASKAAQRYKATLAWRKEMQVDSILKTPQTHYDTIKTHYTQFLHKHDKLGHPLYFEKVGSINIPQLKKAGVSQEALFKHYLFAMEFTIKYAAHQICPCDACVASKTQKMCIVLDARGIGMRDMGGEAFEFIRRCTSVMQHHYPQRSFKIFIVNVPSWFGMAWKGVKPLLNEATRAKTNILTESETASALLEFIDADNLPVEYGGVCSCTGGCEANSSYQRLQRALVQSVLERKPFEAEELVRSISLERSGTPQSGSDEESSPVPTRSSRGSIKREPSSTVLDQLLLVGLVRSPGRSNS